MWQLYLTMWQCDKMSVKHDRMSWFGSNRIVTRSLLCQKRSSWNVLPTTGGCCFGGVPARGGGLSGLKPEKPSASVPATPRTTTEATADHIRPHPTHSITTDAQSDTPHPYPYPLVSPSGSSSPFPCPQTPQGKGEMSCIGCCWCADSGRTP